MWYAIGFIKKTERSVSLILVILGNLVHFSHSIIYTIFPLVG
ncbi:hypothetical protein D1AOALGA4SA_10073 [Olavius algarvensis Delta 1 endosymbiont]|nr:hypothetical protein D1AOALGA4SA_10073 [Olavius algarvensis Delta 1 endosymbiont]